MISINPLLLTDAYKLGHAVQYPEGTTKVYSNFTPRSLKHSPITEGLTDGKVVVFGLQAVLNEMKQIWDQNFFNRDKDEVCLEFYNEILPFVGPSGFDISRIERLHDLGYLPIKIKALPEGSKVSPRVPMLTVENTQGDFFWVTNYLETYLSAELWKPSTVATIANAYRRLLDKYAELTGASPEFVDFQAHDFSARGMSGAVDNMKCGAAHMTSFKGSDSLPALHYLNEHYHGKATFKAASVPATEHSVMCLNGQESELETFRRLITETYPSGIVSIVSDTWDFWQVITEFMPALKDEVINRVPDQMGFAKVVIRPDSGDPVDIICGTAIPVDGFEHADLIKAPFEIGVPTYAVCRGEYRRVTKWEGDEWDHFGAVAVDPTPEMKGAVECLADIFGTTETSKGFKTLNQRVGLIYGDSITLARASEILARLAAKGFSSDNVVLGVGSYSYQLLTRDTFGFAMKATYGVVDGEARCIFKKPKTDDGTKNSAKGLLSVQGGVLINDCTPEQEEQSDLKLVFLDGEILSNETLETIRERLQATA